jgi:hypothetical protein
VPDGRLVRPVAITHDRQHRSHDLSGPWVMRPTSIRTLGACSGAPVTHTVHRMMTVTG